LSTNYDRLRGGGAIQRRFTHRFGRIVWRLHVIVISGGEGSLLCSALVQIIDDPSIFGGRILQVNDANFSDNAATTRGEGQTRLLRLTRLVPVDSGPNSDIWLW